MARTERRLAERYGLKIPIRVSIPKSVVPERTAESLNISTRGICFATDLPLREGSPVQLDFEMPESDQSHRASRANRATVPFLSARRF